MRKLRLYPDPILRKKAKAVKKVNPEINKLMDEMVEIMSNSKGIGLAAPQVGVSEQVIVVDAGDEGILKLANPKIIASQGKYSIEEGCLSFPKLGIKICRAQKVKVKALNESGQVVLIDAKDLLAIVLQHEIDHLHGKLIVDYVSWPKRWFVAKEFKKKNCAL